MGGSMNFMQGTLDVLILTALSDGPRHGYDVVEWIRTETHGAWLLDLTTGSMHRALDYPSAEEFTWAPDGRRVAFHSRRTGEWGLWVMAAR
jgi:DNA-binding PadR family transcriptional regulator